MAKIDLKEQLQKRIDALQALLDCRQPLPGNAPPPTSMAQARAWSEPELGIEKIASKSSTNQKQHKDDDAILTALQELSNLTDRCSVLKQKKKRAPKPTPDKEIENLSKKNYEFKIREVGLSNRLHEVEQELSALKERFENQRLQLTQSTALVVELRRQINASASTKTERPHLSLAAHEKN